MNLGRKIRLLTPLKNYVVKCNRKLFAPKYLLYTNTAISVSMSMFGDIIVQQNQIRKREMDNLQWYRNFSVGVTGFLSGPIFHYWYLLLDWWLPGKTTPVVLKKLVLDQIIASPVFIVLYFGTLGVLERTSWKELKIEIIEKGVILFATEFIVWSPAQLINFYFLPTRYRVLYDNTISLLFDVYCSHLKYGDTYDAKLKKRNNHSEISFENNENNFLKAEVHSHN